MNFNSKSQLEQHTSSHKHQKKVNLRNQIAGQSRQREMTWDCEHGQRGISGGRSNYLKRQIIGILMFTFFQQGDNTF